MKKFMRSRVGAVAVGAAVLVSISSGAYAAGKITGAQIQNQTIRSIDIASGGVGSSEIKDSSVLSKDLAQSTKDALAGQDGKDGKDGKDGVSGLIAGSGYTTTWTGDNGASLQTVREECPAGSYALGGGFSTFGGDKDLGGDNKNIQVTVSAPYFEGDYTPVDDAGNFRPTEWVVKGYNNGSSDQVVRAWVTCAKVSN